MNIALWGYYEDLCKDGYILSHRDAGIGSDLLRPLHILNQELACHGHVLITLDMVSNYKELDAIIFLDYPRSSKLVRDNFDLDIPKYLVVFESILIHPDNWDLEKQKFFDKIFTWNDEIIDNKKYFKMNFSHEMPSSINKSVKKERLCTIIAGNKQVDHPLELYSKRVEAIRWFEEHHPEDFDLYGIGWDEYRFSGSKIVRALNRVKPLTRLLAEKHPSYRGSVKNKKQTLEKYKFSICYENARDIPGYITEKIFDCFFSGCVPVYWGANNISEHIPSSCFIDQRKFSSYEDLYQYIKYMPNEEYLTYLDEIECFIQSKKSYSFSAECFAKTIVDQVVQ